MLSGSMSSAAIGGSGDSCLVMPWLLVIVSSSCVQHVVDTGTLVAVLLDVFHAHWSIWEMSAALVWSLLANRHRSFKSMRYNPRSVSFKGISSWKSLLVMTLRLVSITACNVLKRAFERRNGVDPGTTAIFKCKRSFRGTTNASLLPRVAWFPNRNCTLQTQR